MNSTDDYRGLSIPEMEAALGRFEERVEAALLAAPPSKDWVKRAVRRAGTGRCPVWLKRLSPDLILRHGDALADLFCRYPDDAVRVVPYDLWIGYQPPGVGPRINAVEVAMREAQWEDEWGTRWAHAAGGVGATPVDYPLRDWSQLDEYLERYLPDARDPGRLDAGAAVLERLGASRYCLGTIHLALFERLHAVRGMMNVFSDFYTNENEVSRLLEAIAGYDLELIRRWGELGADAVFLTDDWGSQTGLMISPEMWRRFFKPHYTRFFDEAHRHGMDVVFHSCGNVLGIVADLIDIGMDVLDPVQPGAMDMEELVRRHGGQVSFCGAIDLQQLLCRGRPQQVKDEVRRVIELLGRPYGGGFIISPANVMTPEIPFQNLQALFEATHENWKTAPV
jgi:uroporphyrinogen decarboxylase